MIMSSATRCLKILFFVCYLVKRNDGVGIKIDEEPATGSYDVEAVLGKVAKLPCDIEPAEDNDRVHIIIWFKEIRNQSDPDAKGKRVPIFSLDARDKSIGHAKEWKDDKILGQRSKFRLKDRPATLLLNSVREDDDAIYYCRVDFKQTPTRNIKVNLTTIVPTEKLKIIEGSDDKHIKDYKLGPFNEGASVNITCEATGGRPLPKVTWWLENTLLDESMDYITTETDQKTTKVRNVLTIEKLDRKSLNSKYTCQASNSRLVHPISSTITMDVNLKPLWVKLRGVNKPLSADHTYELECEVVGSRPEPTITWWKGSVQMKNTKETTSPDGNTTVSVLTFAPTVEDAGKYLSCRGQQSLIPESGIEDGWKLDIYHIPMVTLELGSTLNGSTIREGLDVYFECNIKSNPWVYKISWRHNGKQLYNNLAAGIIVTNQSLVLQSVTVAQSGHYTCVGHNQEGDGVSNLVLLDIKFAPVCRPGQQKVFGVARHETAKIACEVEANPSDDVQFIWKFNNSMDAFEIPQSQISIEKSKSVAMFKPITEQDYGALLCWARNEIGMQQEPCVYYIISAGKPSAPSNCTVSNQTSEAIYVECSEGFDGGLPQVFVMEMYETQQRKLVSNVTSKVPVFVVTGLESGIGFDISLYSVNNKGRSGLTHLSGFTLKGAEKRTASSPILLEITPLLGALIGAIAALILIAVIIVIVIRMRAGNDRDDKDCDDWGIASNERRCVAAVNNSDNKANSPMKNSLSGSVDSLEEKNPDIIPQNSNQAEERDFECPIRVYNNQIQNGGYRQRQDNNEVTYAELSINNHLIYNQPPIPLNVIRRPEPTVYAQLDMTRTSQGGFQTLHHPHFVPRPLRDEQMIPDGAEIPLLATNISSLRVDVDGLRSTATLPRPATATRF